MKIGLVRNISRLGHVHREDCLAKGYGTNCEPWTLVSYEAELTRGLANPFDVELLAEKGNGEDLRFCDRCLPDVKWKAWEMRRARRAAEALGVTP